MTDPYTDLLTRALEFEAAADNWESLPMVACVFQNHARVEAVAVWVPDDVWLGAGDPIRTLLILAASVSVTRAIPLLRAPQYPECVGVAVWANQWVDDVDGPADLKLAQFAHVDGDQWRSITRERGTGAVAVTTSQVDGDKPDDALFMQALQIVAGAVGSVRFESHP